MILDYFEDKKVSVEIVSYNTVPDAYGEWVSTETGRETVTGIKYTASVTMQLFQVQLAQNVTDVFLTDEIEPTTEQRLIYNSDEFVIETIDNILETNEVYMIGLRRHE